MYIIKKFRKITDLIDFAYLNSLMVANNTVKVIPYFSFKKDNIKQTNKKISNRH